MRRFPLLLEEKGQGMRWMDARIAKLGFYWYYQ
jgi:hypothetical protein